MAPRPTTAGGSATAPGGAYRVQCFRKPGHDACLSRGRVSRSTRQGHLQQRRRPFSALRVHAPPIRQEHELWAGEWRCTLCELRAMLPKRRCEGMRRGRLVARPPPLGPTQGGDESSGPARRRNCGKRLTEALFRAASATGGPSFGDERPHSLYVATMETAQPSPEREVRATSMLFLRRM